MSKAFTILFILAASLGAQSIPLSGPGSVGDHGGGGGTPMLLTHAAVVSASGGATATTAAINTTSATILVACVTNYNFDTATATVADSKSNTWAHLTDPGYGTINNTNTIFYVVNPTVGSGHTFSATGNYASITVASFSGIATVTPLDQTSTNSGAYNASATTQQPGSITPSQPNTLIVTCEVNGGSGSLTQSINSSFTITDQQNDASGSRAGTALAYLVQGAAAAVNPIWTHSEASNIQATMTSFKP